jgi:hypothetical protein
MGPEDGQNGGREQGRTAGDGTGDGSENGWAVGAAGNATQTRAGGGFVKAMALISPNLADPIRQCFNSQVFGFKVDDRFVSATPVNATGVTTSRGGSVTSTQVAFATYIGDTITKNAFFVFVY